MNNNVETLMPLAPKARYQVIGRGPAGEATFFTRRFRLYDSDDEALEAVATAIGTDASFAKEAEGWLFMAVNINKAVKALRIREPDA